MALILFVALSEHTQVGKLV